MDIPAFENSPSGRLVRGREYCAFVPHPLPPDLSLANLTNLLADANLYLGQVAGIGAMLPNPYLLIRPFLRREAISSSRIEGTRATLSDLFLFEAAETSATSDSDVPEVHNYVRALEYALDRLETLPISLRLIREVHAILLKNVRGSHATPAEFRRTQNWIGPPGCTLSDATYVPPPVDEMNPALDAWEKYLHTPSDLPFLIQLALIHYQFEAIHPFLDGNGRIGRLLMPLLMCERGILQRPFFYLSPFFEQHRDTYYRLLLTVSRDGAWNDWLVFFLRGIRSQAEDTALRAKQLITLQTTYRERLQKTRSSTIVLQLVDKLFESPAVTVSNIAKVFDITFRSAQNNIDKLVTANILTEITGRSRNRIYMAKEILAMLDH